jgi:hypothetical protein
MEAWLSENWFNLLSAIGIIGGLLFTAFSLRSETKTRRIENLLILTQSHREIWAELFRDPDLARVLNPIPELSKKPLSRDESIFVNMVIQHLSSTFEALKTGLTIKSEGLKKDVGDFFSLPIPRTIWEKLKPLQNDDFVKFVDGCLDNAKRSSLSRI